MENIKHFKDLFLLQKQEILNRQKISPEIDQDDSKDEIDLAQNIVIHDMLEKLSVREQESLFKINDALLRIEQGSFGLCTECEEPISEKRIFAIPYCTMCIFCAEAEEKLSKQYQKSF